MTSKMDYKIKSVLTISVLLLFMITTAVFINNLEGTITGSVVQGSCACTSASDCNDDNVCTKDYCLYADNCAAALCVNQKIEGCNLS